MKLVGAPRFVLIVEDDYELATLIPPMLMPMWPKDETTCLIVESLAKAICACQKDTPDLVLLDLRLPDSDGIETVERLAQYLPVEVPIVAMSGFYTSVEGRGALGKGALAFLSKQENFSPQVVRETLRYAWASAQGLARRRALQKNRVV